MKKHHRIVLQPDEEDRVRFARIVMNHPELGHLLRSVRHRSVELEKVLLTLVTAAQATATTPAIDEATQLLETLAEHLPQELPLCLDLFRASPQGEYLLRDIQRAMLLDSETYLARSLDELPILSAFDPCILYIMPS